MSIILKTVSSLEKIFCDEPLRAPELRRGSAAGGEVYSLQVAMLYDAPDFFMASQVLKIDAQSPLPLEIRQVSPVPVSIPQTVAEENMLRLTPGLYPDVLEPLPEGNYVRLTCSQWQSLWLTVRVPADCTPGVYPVKVTATTANIDQTAEEDPKTTEAVFDLEVLPFNLPESTLLRYEWFHCDCLASYYKVAPWSEEHWKILENFVQNAARHEMNVLMTPLWTLPLDTRVGGERPTVQLLNIIKEGDKYRFDFSRLERYITMGLRCGIKRFAMSHAFTQWGAYATPKILATVDGQEKRIFGWDVPANSPEYADFLSQLMPQLLAVFRKLNIIDKVFFSVSDEPTEKYLESYGYASKLLKSLIGEIPTLDALSSFEFYQRGLVERPVVCNDHIEAFVGNVKEMWTYYCCAQNKLVPNRFIAMPSARTRIMGLMLYLYDAVGFLQWAFNFYYSQFSISQVDPYRETSAGKWVPAGDAFIVYPGQDGTALDSLRHEVFFDGLQDLRALRALEAKIGRDAVIAMVQDGLNYTIDMKHYPWSADWLLNLRERINRALAEK